MKELKVFVNENSYIFDIAFFIYLIKYVNIVIYNHYNTDAL